jgi:hypothetical protein
MQADEYNQRHEIRDALAQLDMQIRACGFCSYMAVGWGINPAHTMATLLADPSIGPSFFVTINTGCPTYRADWAAIERMWPGIEVVDEWDNDDAEYYS